VTAEVLGRGHDNIWCVVARVGVGVVGRRVVVGATGGGYVLGLSTNVAVRNGSDVRRGVVVLAIAVVTARGVRHGLPPVVNLCSIVGSGIAGMSVVAGASVALSNVGHVNRVGVRGGGMRYLYNGPRVTCPCMRGFGPKGTCCGDAEMKRHVTSRAAALGGHCSCKTVDMNQPTAKTQFEDRTATDRRITS
jgi:hypothetical protein